MAHPKDVVDEDQSERLQSEPYARSLFASNTNAGDITREICLTISAHRTVCCVLTAERQLAFRIQ